MINKIHNKGKRRNPDPEDLIRGIREGNKTFLARAITLVESNKNDDRALAYDILDKLSTTEQKSLRIGITGVPGVGKSTFIEAFGSHLTSLGLKIAVLAVDPSSSVSKGSILGDKTRMVNLSRDPSAFIRPSASGETLGGVARSTRETMVLCEAAGYDVVLIETVGVGQSETSVHAMSDFFLLLKLSGAGDELQGIKRGIMEMADAIVINKADGENVKPAKEAKEAFQRALHLYPPKENEWIPQVSTCSALESHGIPEIWTMIKEFEKLTRENGSFNSKRGMQNEKWFRQAIEHQLKSRFYENPEVTHKLPEILSSVRAGKISPFRAAEALLKVGA